VRTVFWWVTDTAGCFHYRVELPSTRLDPTRFRTAWGAPGPDIHDYDVVVGQRLAGDNPGWEALCRDPTVLTVYDMDDDLLNIEPENQVPYAIYHPLRDGTRRNVKMADVVITCSGQMAEVLTPINPNVHVLPICVPGWVIDLPVRRGPGEPNVGWAGSMFQAQNWGDIQPRLWAYAQMVPEARFHMVGADYTSGVLGGRCRTTGWGTVDSMYRALDFDIGIAPLNPKLHGSRVRSWTKPLQYAARGIPVVATAAGQYTSWVEDGTNGFLVHHPRQWLDHLITLSDPTVRAPMSTAAREKARGWTIEANIGLWEDALCG
jgi:Glycosyl transferases group 1